MKVSELLIDVFEDQVLENAAEKANKASTQYNATKRELVEVRIEHYSGLHAIVVISKDLEDK